MKKYFLTLLLSFSIIPCVNAAMLNFRTNQLQFFEYKLDETMNTFTIFTNNQSDELMYSLAPSYTPEYQKDYEQKSFSFVDLDLTLQNKIKYYLRATKNASEFATQMYYYMHTQMLLWEVFKNPVEPQAKYQSYQEEFEKYGKELEDGVPSKPNWMKDYEMESELIISRDDNWLLSSDSCEIENNEEFYRIANCTNNSKIVATENLVSNMKVYQNNEEIILEGANDPYLWEFNITLSEEEEKLPNNEELPKNEGDEEDDEVKNEKNDIEFIPNDESDKKQEEVKLPEQISQDSEKKKIDNVPNTWEEISLLPIFSFIMLICLNLGKLV